MPMPKLVTATPALDRRSFLLALGGTLIAPRAFAAPSPEQFSARLAQAERDGRISGLHALLVSQGGKLVFEHYGQGDDEQEGRGRLPNVVFGPDVPHDLRSVSKSVVGLAYGIALAAGKVPPPEAKLYEQFPEYADLARQPGRDRITVHHVLSMTLGLDWDELTVPYGDDLRNSEIAMEAAPDRFRFILERPMVDEPGTRWTYCGGATAILGRLISKGTGEPLLAYCRRVLFDPMGFGPVDWAKGRGDGQYRAASGLRLLPRDLLKIGELGRAGGAWDGQQIVPRDWLKRSATPAVMIEGRFRYGYHWYLGASGTSQNPQRWIGGIGWGGQRLYVFPALDVVVAHCSGNYDKPNVEQRRINNAIVNDVVLPGFV